MSENHPSGYLETSRNPIGKRPASERTGDYNEIYLPMWDESQLSTQGGRCMDCGVPTCMGGCPIGNLIPEWNDLVYEEDWRAALERLHATNNFPEFTGYTCPAPCEDACVLAYNDDPVTIKSIERAIVDKGWEEGWIAPQPPTERTSFSVAVVGSGPAGLAAAQQLNRAGHSVTVFERDDAIGGLMMYGIPDFKFAKHQVERRVNQMKEEGVTFCTGVEVGKDVTLEKLRDDFSAVCLAVGAQKHRDLSLPGRDLRGIELAMNYLPLENRRQAGRPVEGMISAEGKNVVVLGGGDTGADCVGTAHRQGAKQVVQISINEQKPLERPHNNPWPEAPQTYEKTYAQEEGGEEVYSVNSVAFLDMDDDGVVNVLQAERVDWIRDESGSRVDKEVLESDIHIPADLVLVAIGFTGAQLSVFEKSGLGVTDRGTLEVDETMMTNLEGVFAAGDANRGQSLVVWAIGEGRDVARQIDSYLMGQSRLPFSLRTQHLPLGM